MKRKGGNALFSFDTVNTTLNIWGFTLIMTNSDNRWLFNSSQLSHYLPGVSIRFLRLRAQLSQNCLHFSCKLQVPGCPKCLWLSSYKSGFSQLAPRIWIICYNSSPSPVKHWLTVTSYFLVRDLIEDTDEQPDEAMHISEGSWVQDLQSPWLLKHTTLMVHGCVDQPRRFQILLLQGLFYENCIP